MNYNDLERLKKEVVERCKKRLAERGKPLYDEKSTSELLRKKHNI